MKKSQLQQIIREEITKTLNEAPKKAVKPLSSFIVSGSEFKTKYATDFKGKKAKVLYKNNLNIGSNMGKGSYWCVTQDCLDTYSVERDQEFGSKYAMYVKDIVYKPVPNNIKILVKEGIAWDLWQGKNKDKLYLQITKMADGVYDPDQDDFGLLLFKDIK